MRCSSRSCVCNGNRVLLNKTSPHTEKPLALYPQKHTLTLEALLGRLWREGDFDAQHEHAGATECSCVYAGADRRTCPISTSERV